MRENKEVDLSLNSDISEGDVLNEGLSEDRWPAKDLVAILKKQIEGEPGTPSDTLLHLAARSSSLSSENFAKLLTMISSEDSELISKVACVRDKQEDKNIFFLIEEYGFQDSRVFYKKVEVNTFIQHLPDVRKGIKKWSEPLGLFERPSLWKIFQYILEDTIGDHKTRTTQASKARAFFNEKEKEKINSLMITVSDILRDTREAIKNSETLLENDHPSWFFLHIKNYQAAYNKVQKQQTPDKQKSNLLLVTMFHLSARAFYFNRDSYTPSFCNPATELLFSTLQLILTQPAHEIVDEMQAENNQTDIQHLINLLGFYRNNLFEEIEKSKIQLKISEYEELLVQYKKKVPSENKKEDACPLHGRRDQALINKIWQKSKEAIHFIWQNRIEILLGSILLSHAHKAAIRFRWSPPDSSNSIVDVPDSDGVCPVLESTYSMLLGDMCPADLTSTQQVYNVIKHPEIFFKNVDNDYEAFSSDPEETSTDVVIDKPLPRKV